MVKLCDAEILEATGCAAFVYEANNLRRVTELAKRNQCFNFPVFYIYGKCCLFCNMNKYDITRLELICDSNIPDIFVLLCQSTRYAGVPRHYRVLLQAFSNDCLLKSRETLKLKNFKVIKELFPLSDKSLSRAKY